MEGVGDVAVIDPPAQVVAETTPTTTADTSISASSDGRSHLRVLPPAANWYCSQVCDWGYDARDDKWYIVYGANNVICIYEFITDEPTPTDGKKQEHLEEPLKRPLRMNFVALLRRGKKDGRVTALKCHTDADGELRVVCAGEEGAVQIWNPLTLARVDQHRKHSSTEVTAIGIRAGPDLNWIVAGDRQGCLSLWQRDIDSVQTFTPLPRDAVFAMDVAPHDQALVAVGYRSGAVCLVDLVEKNIRYRLDGHDLEVHSVVWAPQQKSETTDSSVWYFATGSRDRTIKVWAVNDQKEEATAPSMVSRLEVRKPQQASSHSQANRLWLPLAWTSTSASTGKYGLWSGSFEGNLQLWQWNGAPNGTVKPSTFIKNGHNRLLFSIVPIHVSQEAMLRQDTAPVPPLLLTISLDRDIRVWRENTDVQPMTATCIERMPAQGGFVYSLDYNSSKKLLACGVGDQTIRLWSLSSPSAKQAAAGSYQAELVWKGMQSKVTCVRWHPMQDGVLAFGTEDGRVGLWDLRSKTTQRLKLSHSSGIQDIVWTVHTPPQIDEDEAESGSSSFVQAMEALEAAQTQGMSLDEAMSAHEGRGSKKNGQTSGEVVIYLWSLDRAGVLNRTDLEKQMTLEVRTDCQALTWDPATSFTTLAVGGSSGKVEIYTHSLGTSTSGSPSGGPSGGQQHGLVLHTGVHEHKESVTALAWGSHGSDSSCGGASLLASGSKNGEIIVYENIVETTTTIPSRRQYERLPGYGQQVVAVFNNHSGATINCIQWNNAPMNGDEQNDLLASCGNDGVANVWSICTQSAVAAFKLHIGRVFSVVWISSTILSSGGQDQTIRVWDYHDHLYKADLRAADIIKQQSQRKALEKDQDQATLDASLTGDDGREDRSSRILKSTTASKPKQQKNKSADSHNKSIFLQADTSWLLQRGSDAWNEKIGVGDGATLTLNHRNVMAVERLKLEKDEHWERAAHVLLLDGRIADSLRLVATHGALSASWVAYAPMAGQEVWREIAHLYAKQLQDAGDMKDAALQFLAIGKVESAIQCFTSCGLFVEAINVIVSRLGAHHPLLAKTLWAYGAHLEKKKNKLRDAVDIYLSINSTAARMRAVTMLGSTGKVEDARKAMAVWTDHHKKLSCPEKNGEEPQQQQDAATLPTSVFMSCLSLALTHRDSCVARQALNGLVASVANAPTSSQYIGYKLSLCVVGIAALLASPHQDQDDGATEALIETEGEPEECQKKMREAHELLKVLQCPSRESWPATLPSHFPSPGPHSFWSAALDVCRAKGLWFSGSELAPDEIVELLGDPTVFDFLWPAGTDQDSTLGELLTSSRLILKFLAELLSGYLLSALEALRDFVSFLASCKAATTSQTTAMFMVVFPTGLIDVANPPAVGELIDEADDTLVLWTECFLHQCELLVDGIMVHLHSTSEQDKADSHDQLNRVMKSVMEITTTATLPASATTYANQVLTKMTQAMETFRQLQDIHTTAQEKQE